MNAFWVFYQVKYYLSKLKKYINYIFIRSKRVSILYFIKRLIYQRRHRMVLTIDLYQKYLNSN